MEADVRREIEERLSAGERDSGATILFAAESGSRAWGFASEDSDWDVRFVYVHPAAHYLRLEKQRDVLELCQDARLDIVGWDLRKALTLLRQGNCTLHEWAASPTVYRTSPLFEQLRESLPAYFMPKPAMFHYLGRARHDIDKHLDGEQVRLKKYLYITWALLCAEWVAQTRSTPPVPFDELCSAVLPDSLTWSVREMLNRKRDADEQQAMRHNPQLDAWIRREVAHLTTVADKMLPEERPDWATLDAWLYQATGVKA